MDPCWPLFAYPSLQSFVPTGDVGTRRQLVVLFEFLGVLGETPFHTHGIWSCGVHIYVHGCIIEVSVLFHREEFERTS